MNSPVVLASDLLTLFSRRSPLQQWPPSSPESLLLLAGKVNLHTLRWPLSDFKCSWQSQNYTSGGVRGDGFIASSSVHVTFERSPIPEGSFLPRSSGVATAKSEYWWEALIDWCITTRSVHVARQFAVSIPLRLQLHLNLNVSKWC